jgi:hypothetical protein
MNNTAIPATTNGERTSTISIGAPLYLPRATSAGV